jgi:hypothetical protein
MPGNPRGMITTAERTFPLRIRIAILPGGLGRRHAQMTAWPDDNCGADGWAMTPSVMRGVLNAAGGVFQVRDDEPASRVGAGLHRTPSRPQPRTLHNGSWRSHLNHPI